ncbi:uncharacterized protein LOC121135245 [Mesocricetus auratus]|uniref:Uncharacterized protein LOC121135245 n=1 Tax=Mesocricetus auratus TaxID=10036 RepID=A0ABM2WFW9_MESAU|nr:uncharacterized protein LOC121135245 [Mesocricetus auratus]XP_040589697.1 uncharacterized protein LOC121135245 [Mesocricetus auratus]XP_040589698.1 uncharacterized protein LOC121135245 [Mesocricetus auratus]
MSARKQGSQVRDQHFAEGDDLVKLTPSRRRVTKVTDGSSGKKSPEPRTPQTALPRRPQDHPAKKPGAVERGRADEKTCTAENKPSTEKHHTAEKRNTARMNYVTLDTELPETILIDNDYCNDEECPATEKGPSDRKHQFKKQLSGRRHCFSEKSCSLERHLSAEKDLATQRDFLNKKRCLTEKVRSTEEVGLGERVPYEERGHPTEGGHPAKKGLSTKKCPSPKKDYLDERGPAMENHHPEEKDRSAKKLTYTQRDLQIDGEHSVGRGRPSIKSHPAEKGWSANKSGSAGRGHRIKSHPAKEGCSAERVNMAQSRLFAGEDTNTRRGRPIQRCRAEQGRSVERATTVKKRPSTAKDHPTGRSRPQKKSNPAEEGQSTDRGAFAGENVPTGRGRLSKKSPCAKKHLSTESHPEGKELSSKIISSTEKVHSEERRYIVKKTRQLSAKKGSMGKKFVSGESVDIQDSYTHDKSSTGQNGCSVEQGHPSMEKGFPVETPSSGSVPVVPVPKSTQDAPETSTDSATSQLPQVTHQNVAGAVTNGQHTQAVNMRMGVKLKLPQELKACLVDDWNLINTYNLLFQLPADINVDCILANYVAFVKSQGKSDSREYYVDELVYGIREYFNIMLGNQLLYHFEKAQYVSVLMTFPDIPMSQIYGAPHLLRLFVKIGSALTNFCLNRCSLILVSGYMHDFLNFLAENSTSLFSVNDYNMPSALYSLKEL